MDENIADKIAKEFLKILDNYTEKMAKKNYSIDEIGKTQLLAASFFLAIFIHASAESTDTSEDEIFKTIFRFTNMILAKLEN
jgi:hypothetical protein